MRNQRTFGTIILLTVQQACTGLRPSHPTRAPDANGMT